MEEIMAFNPMYNTGNHWCLADLMLAKSRSLHLALILWVSVTKVPRNLKIHAVCKNCRPKDVWEHIKRIRKMMRRFSSQVSTTGGWMKRKEKGRIQIFQSHWIATGRGRPESMTITFKNWEPSSQGSRNGRKSFWINCWQRLIDFLEIKEWFKL